MVFWLTLATMGLLFLACAVHSIALRIRHRGHWDFQDVMEETYGWLVLAIVGGFIAICVALIASANPPGLHPEMSKRYGLHALVTKDQTESSLSGSFFLGFGGVQGDSSTTTKIVYIRTDTDGGNKIKDTTVGRSIIYEDLKAGEKPYVEDWVSAAQTTTVWVPWTWHYVAPGEAQHRFHIPKGSILSNYEVNP